MLTSVFVEAVDSQLSVDCSVFAESPINSVVDFVVSCELLVDKEATVDSLCVSVLLSALSGRIEVVSLGEFKVVSACSGVVSVLSKLF